MKTFSLPKRISGVVFDLDNTLYFNEAYIDFQNSSLINRFAEDRGMTFEEASSFVFELRKMRAGEGKARPSLTEAFGEKGVDIPTSVAWREELFRPEDHLQTDPRLQEMMQILRKRFRIGVVSNNPRSVIERSLEVLGISHDSIEVVGLDTCHEPKPSFCGFAYFLNRTELSVEECVVVGDRYDIDLEPVITRGGGGVLIEKAGEIYRIYDILVQSI